MKQYHYTINNGGKLQDLVIYTPVDQEGRYAVELEGNLLGYLFYADLDTDKSCPMWQGSTPSLTLMAAELGAFLEQSDADD